MDTLDLVWKRKRLLRENAQGCEAWQGDSHILYGACVE